MNINDIKVGMKLKSKVDTAIGRKKNSIVTVLMIGTNSIYYEYNGINLWSDGLEFEPINTKKLPDYL